MLTALKDLAREVEAASQPWLPLDQGTVQSLSAWASLHGWDPSDAEAQRLLVRQAILNALVLRVAPSVKEASLPTPLDSLQIQVPELLAQTICDAARRVCRPSDFWGEFHNALIPQARRRRIGQFWTSQPIAHWMITWLLETQPCQLADLGCGSGNFLLEAARQLAAGRGATQLWGCDVSPLLLNLVLAAFETLGDEAYQIRPTLVGGDYLKLPLPEGVDAVVSNPPYTRHHHISSDLKDRLQSFFKSRLHVGVSRQATMAFYFLLKVIADMRDGARAAVIVPMEVLDARYGTAAKRVLCQQTTLNAIVHFSPQMNAFDKVDVGASILLFTKGYERHNQVRNLTLTSLPATADLLDCLAETSSGSREVAFGSLSLESQDELLAFSKWFGIATAEASPAEWKTSGLIVPLKALAKVVRGIATGANEFFALPTTLVRERGLQPYVVRTLQRNREVQGIVLDEAKWQELSEEGKRVWLLYLNGELADGGPQLEAYLKEGESRGYSLRSLVQTRKKWFAMEQREVPPIFFTILTRGNPRFILNLAGVRPLNMFSLIYPNTYVTRAGATEVLWALLNGRFSLSRLHSVSRTYGGNTLKVEPRELDNLPVINPLALPTETVEEIKAWIDSFHRNGDASLLIGRVDDVVDRLLASKTPAKARISLPRQLELLEGRADYKAKKG